MAIRRILEVPFEIDHGYYDDLELDWHDFSLYALFWQPTLRSVIAYNGQTYRVIRGSWPLYALQCHAEIGDWLRKHEADLGCGDAHPRHWLVLETCFARAFVAVADLARELVAEQRVIGLRQKDLDLLA